MADIRNARAAQLERQNEAIRRASTDLGRMESELAKVLPKYVPAERIVRIATTAIRKNPDLAECSAVSLGGAVMMAATLGLEMNTPTGEAYLIPRRESGVMEATMQVGYQGWCKLWWQHPRAGKLRAVAVYPGDEFAWQLGTHAEIHHVPRPELRKDGDEPTHYYATATLLGSAEPEFEVMTAAEVLAIRGKVGPSGRIADPQRWMEKKVPLRQLLKIMPKSTTAALAVSSDDRSGRELLQPAAERVQSERADQTPEVAAEGANGSEWPVTRPIPGEDT